MTIAEEVEFEVPEKDKERVMRRYLKASIKIYFRILWRDIKRRWNF